MDLSNIFFLLKETQFVVDEVSNVIKEAIETTIGGNSYTVKLKRGGQHFFLQAFMSSCVQHAKVNQWTNGVVESCLASLTKLQKPFKYIVTCVIMQVSVSSHKHLSHEGVIAFSLHNLYMTALKHL